MKYKTLLFDFGGVIINIDFSLTYQAFADLGVADLEMKFAQHQQNAFFDKFEKGQIPPATFRDEVRKMLGRDLPDTEIDQAWNAMLLDIPQDRVALIQQLKKDYRCVLLSNTNQIHYDFYRQNFEDKFGYQKFSNLFDETFFSHQIGMRKPDAEIYGYILKELNESPEQILFIDDTFKNLEAAQKHGIQTLLWESSDLSQLQSFL